MNRPLQELPGAVLTYEVVYVAADKNRLWTIGFALDHKYPFRDSCRPISLHIDHLVCEKMRFAAASPVPIAFSINARMASGPLARQTPIHSPSSANRLEKAAKSRLSSVWPYSVISRRMSSLSSSCCSRLSFLVQEQKKAEIRTIHTDVRPSSRRFRMSDTVRGRAPDQISCLAACLAAISPITGIMKVSLL